MERVQAAATRPRRKTPSFSSSLLDAIYHSIDEQSQQRATKDGQGQDTVGLRSRRNNGAQVEAEIESLRRAIMVEKWMENYAARSNSGSSTDSGAFSSSETDSSSASASGPNKSATHGGRTRLSLPGITKQAAMAADATPKREGRFTRTKSRAMKIYGDLKKVKEPSSPGGKIASFLNSIFSPRSKNHGRGGGAALENDFGHVRKSRSMKDPSTTTSASTSCLSKNHSSSGAKSNRSVRFCPVSTILDEDKNIIKHDKIGGEFPVIGSRFIKKNIGSFRLAEGKNQRRHEFREFYDNESDLEMDDDGMSCASSDLFELENIVGGRVTAAMYEEELPVYGTTSVAMNQAIANHHHHHHQLF